MADDINEANTAPKKSKKKKIIILVLILLLLSLIGGGGYLGYAWMRQLPPFEPAGPTPEEIAAQKAAAEEARQAELTERFVTFDHAFTFNLSAGGKPHMMQMEVVLMVMGESNESLARAHLPLIGAVISEITAQQNYEALIAQTGRQRLKRVLLEAIRSRLSGVAHEPVVEQVLFTSFVIQ